MDIIFCSAPDTPPQRAPPPAPVETEETYEVPDDKSGWNRIAIKQTVPLLNGRPL